MAYAGLQGISTIFSGFVWVQICFGLHTPGFAAAVTPLAAGIFLLLHGLANMPGGQLLPLLQGNQTAVTTTVLCTHKLLGGYLMPMRNLAFMFSCPADVPKALVAAVVLRDQARPEWPDSSSMINLVVSAAAAAAGASAHEGMPPMAYRELAASCWAHEARDRWALARCCFLETSWDC